MSHYVNNKDFMSAMVERRLAVEQCISEGKDPPIISNVIAKSIYDICNHLSYRPNFIGYSYRDEMVADAIENCLKVVDKFDSVKYNNPFAYFTQIAYYAFLRRIADEKKQAYIKGAILSELPIDELVDLEDYDGTPIDFVEELRQKYYFDTQEWENKKKSKKETKSKIEEFME